MKTFTKTTLGTIASLVVLAAPFAAFAQQNQSEIVTRASVGPAPLCTQLEMQAGIEKSECGSYSISELSEMKFDAED